jgi:hypothetical protein
MWAATDSPEAFPVSTLDESAQVPPVFVRMKLMVSDE